jgi:uncharacterized repeat protein (TIGR01451 family)
VVLVHALAPAPAAAFVAGPWTHQPLSTHKIFGNARPVGNTLMLPGPAGAEIRSILLTSSQSALSTLPTDAVVEKAYLFWSGSLAQQGVTGPKVADPQVSFSVANGQSYTVTGTCTTVTHPTLGNTFPSFYYCRSDVTTQVANNKLGGAYNGVYIVGGVNADPGHVNAATGNCTETPYPRCQAKYAAWSLVVIYSSPSEPLQRDIHLYDGFRIVDHEDGPQGSLGVETFTISGFLADSTPDGTLSYFAVETDAQLGIPPQNLSPPPYTCTTCQDYVKFNGTTLQDNLGWPGNIFNESLGNGYGVDIDTIEVGSLLSGGATSATIEVGSGTGPVLSSQPPHGGGELFGFGWTLLSLRRPSPNFKSSATNKSVNPTTAGQGETLAYTVNIVNTGSMAATGTVLTDVVPADVDYKPGSLQVNGVPCTDAADGDACTVSGKTITINLGTVSHLLPQNSRQITFLGTVSAGAANGQVICNTASVTSNQTPTPHSTAPACFTVKAPELSTPTKVALDLDGGLHEPEDFIQFTVTIPRKSTGQITGLSFDDDIPANMSLIVANGPPGATVTTSTTGGAFGRGYIQVTGITIPAGVSSVTITFTVRVDSEAELVASGVPAGAIDGHTLCNQGQVSALFLTGPISTDDPAVAGTANPTCLTLTYAPEMGTSHKTVVDVNGGKLEPGDTLRYTVTFANTGNQPATLDVQDDLPPHVANFTWIQQPVGATFTPGAGANGTGRITIAGLTVAPEQPGPPPESVTMVFEVTVAAAAPHNAAIQNCATFAVAQKPSEGGTICSASLNVFSAPDLSASQKTVVDQNGGTVQPGDLLTYTITVDNSGNKPATAVVVTDVASVHLTAVTPGQGGTYDAATRTITWNVGSVGPGAQETLTFTAEVVTPTPNNTQLCNQGVVASAELAPEPTDNPATPAANDPTCVNVVSAPDLSPTTKEVQDLNGGDVVPGDTLRYTITVINQGTETATNVIVTDQVPPELTNVSPLDGGTLSGSTITWNVGSLTPGQQAVVRFEADVVTPLVNGTQISNQAFVGAAQLPVPVPSDDPKTTTPDDPTVVTVTSSADLSTTQKTVVDVNGGVPQPGDQLSYTITVVNTGDAPAQGAVVTDVVSTDLESVVPLDGGVWSAATRTITWPAADVVPGTNRVLRFSASLVFPMADGTVVCNQGSVTSQDVTGAVLTDDPATAAAADPTCVTVESEPDLAPTTKTVADLNGGDVVPGDVLRYTITVDNQGTQNATGVVVTDVVSTDLTSVTPLDGGVWNAATRTITWNVGLAPAKGQVTVRFDAQVVLPLDDGTQISNQGSVTAAEITTPVLTDDPATPATDDPTVVTVVSSPLFSTSQKTVTDVNGGLVEPGDTLAYTLTIVNTGTSLADNVTVADVLDQNVNFASAGQGGSYNAATRTITWSGATTPALVQMGVGTAASVTLTFQATVVSPIVNGTQICNQGLIQSAEVTAPQPTDNPQTPPAGDPTCVTVFSAPDLSGTTKTVTDANGAPVRPGDTLTWTITLTNTGNAPAENVVVTDPVDASLQNVIPGQGGVFNAVTRIITWSPATTPQLTSLAAGASLTLSFTATVAKPLDNDTKIQNQATVTGKDFPAPVLTDDPGTPAIDDPTVVTVVSAPDLSTSEKTVLDQNGGDVEPGDALTWTLTLKNGGDALAKNVVVTDVVDPSLVNVAPLDGGTYNLTTRTITWNVPVVGLTPSGDVQVRFTAQVLSPLANGTLISNQGSVQVGAGPPALTDDPSTSATDDPTTVTVVSKPDFSEMTKTVAGATPNKKVAPGTTLTYTITVPNKGTENAVNLQVTDVVDQNLVSVVPLDGGTYDAVTRTITWSVPLLAVGSQISLRFQAAVKADAKNNALISNQAFAQVQGQPDKTPSDDPSTPTADDPTVLTVEAISDLTQFDKAVKDQNGGDVEPGDTLEYTLTVRNTGSAYAFNIVVTDVVQTQNLENVQPGQGGQYSPGSSTITWNASTTPELAKLAPGGQVVLTFTARVKVPTNNGTQIFNQAVARADDVTPEPSDDPATSQVNDPTRVKVVSVPNLGDSKKTVGDLNGGLVKPGDTLEYTIRVINSGKSVATGVTLLDAIPAYTSYISSSTRLNGALAPDVGGASPVSKGILVSSPGQPPGQVNVGEQNAAVVRFRVRVNLDTPQGRIVSNQGMIKAKETPVEPTDDPATPADDDPTQIVVGAGPNLNNTVKVFAPKPLGDNGNGQFDPGEVIAYSVTIHNTGTTKATGVVFTDPLDPDGRATYVNPMTLNGTEITAAADGDPGAVGGNRIRVVVGTIKAGEIATITYRVKILSGPIVVNQGTVRCTELQPELTDADGNDGNGDQPTVVPISGPASRKLRGDKTVLDLDGGEVQPGDELLYTITVHNDGNGTESVDIIDDLPKETTFIGGSLAVPPGATQRFDPAPAGQNGRGQVSTTVPLGPGGSATVIFRARLDQGLADGSSVCNTAGLGGGGGLDLQPPIEPACVLIGSPVGTGGLEGQVFRDIGTDNRVRDPEDQLLSGFQVQAYAQGNPNATPLAAAASDGEGRYRMDNLPPGVYTMRALSSKGAQMGTLSTVTVTGGKKGTRDLPVDPSGVVYDSVTGKPVAGARATLRYDSTDPVAPGATVPGTLLGPGQQGQVTDENGFYRFDVQRGRKYEIVVDPLTPSLQFPSALIPATAGFAKVDSENEVVPADVPDVKKEGADLTYYLRFALWSGGAGGGKGTNDEGIFNNHIPVDPLTSLIRLEKRIDRRRASVGDMATYTITVQNRSTRAFTLQGSRVVVEDVLPRGLRFLRGTTRVVRRLAAGGSCTQDEIATRDIDGASVCLSRQEPAGASGRVMRFGPLPMGAGESLKLIYQCAVGLDTRQGSYRNRAVLRDEGLTTTLSNRDEAVLLVEPDPDLDQGLLIGRVFCDVNKNGRVDQGDYGVRNARVYLDNGTYSVTDMAGKYHLRDIDPGLHLLKVDVNTLPVGSRLTTDESRVVQLTRGLPAKIDFGVVCRENWVKVQKVELKKKKKKKKKKAKKKPKKKLVVPGLSLAGDVPALRLSADGGPVPLLDVDLALTRAGSAGLPADWRATPALRLRRDGRLRRGLIFHLKAEGRAVRGWRLTVLRLAPGANRLVVRRFSGRGSPPAQLAWDGRLAGKPALERGLYEARLEAMGFAGDGGSSPVRVFIVDRAPVPPPEDGPHSAFLDGTRLTLDRKGRFSKLLGRVDRRQPLVELRRGDGKSAWVLLGEAVSDVPEPQERLKVEGNLRAPKLTVDGKLVDTALLQIGLVAVGKELPPLGRDGRLKTPQKLSVAQTVSLVRRWTLRVAAARGGKGRSPAARRSGATTVTARRPAHALRTITGVGAPPPVIEWDGAGDDGKAVVTPGETYLARLSLEDDQGNRGRSALLELRAPPAVAFGGLKLERRRLFNPRTGAPAGVGRVQLIRVLRLLKRRPGGERYRLNVRLAPPEKWDSAKQAGLIKSVRRSLQELIKKQGIDPERFELTVAALPPGGAGGKAAPGTPIRRESIFLDAVPPPPVTAAGVTARVLVDGEPIPVSDKDGTFSVWAKVQMGSALIIDMRDSTGRRAVIVVPTKPKARIPVSGISPGVPAYSPPRVASYGGGPTLSLEMRGGSKQTIRLTTPPVGLQLAQAPASAPASAPSSRPAPPPATTSLAPQARAAGAKSGQPFGAAELEEAFGMSQKVLKRALGSTKKKKKAPVHAAQLQVNLPPRGAVLKSHELALRGRTHPKNRVTINGQRVRVEADGTFDHVVKLPDGQSELKIQATDEKGHRGTIRWPVEVSSRALFLMAMAEGAIGQVGAELDGDTDHSRAEAGPVMLHGRTVLYLKGRIKGRYLFKNYFVTAHVDTAKQREFSEFFDQVVDPNRYYPVYGDSSRHVRDVNARDKYYLLVKADRSSLLVGNFRAGVKGIELLRYDRVLYGAKVDLDKAFFSGKLRQQAKAFVSYDDARLARDHNVLRATGGSIYYLRHGQVLEGSERVRLVVRERDTGLLLATLPKSRDLDYVIDYPGGRILFKGPVSSVADAGFSVQNPAFTLSTLSGHPVYVEVDYEYESEGEGGAGSWGVQVKDTLFDVLTVGGSYVSESRNADLGGDYRLYGGDVTLRHGKASQLTFEVARSESIDAHNYFSEDGGITYLGMNHIAKVSADERSADSNAYKVSGTLELSDFVKRVKPGTVQAQAYFSRLDRGFYSGGTILDQGRTKYGGRVEWAVTDRDKITVRHDGAIALLPQMPFSGSNLDSLALREIETELTRARYELRRGRLELAGEYAHMYLRDPTTTGLDSHRDTLGVLASVRVHKRIRLLLGQDAIVHVTGSDAQLGTGNAAGLNVASTADWRDRLMTSAGAALTLTKSLEAQLMESVRWSGDNATSIGLKARVSKTASMYVRQILGNEQDRFTSTSVVGAEDKLGPGKEGRTYGEYQLQSGILGLNNRAILGVTNKWTPWRGISFTGGYEHQQVFGGRLPDGTPTGDSQRDVAHVGFEYIRPRSLKLSTRAELRYDNAAGVAGIVAGTGSQASAANVDTRAGLGQGNYGDRITLPGSQLLLTPGERWQIVSRTAASWAATRDLTLLARVNFYHTLNRTTDRVEAEALELGVGAALRPIEWDFLNVLFKYTRIMEMRPISFTDDLSRYRTYDIISVAPILELPWRFQLVEKLAYKRVSESLDILPGERIRTVVQTLLWINRLNFHLTGKLDVGAEYRFLKMLFDNQGGQLKHGALVELGYWVHKYVRLGAGYNFTSFTDNEFSDQDRDAKGFFFRVVGRY